VHSFTGCTGAVKKISRHAGEKRGGAGKNYIQFGKKSNKLAARIFLMNYNSFLLHVQEGLGRFFLFVDGIPHTFLKQGRCALFPGLGMPAFPAVFFIAFAQDNAFSFTQADEITIAEINNVYHLGRSLQLLNKAFIPASIKINHDGKVFHTSCLYYNILKLYASFTTTGGPARKAVVE
jgi:hypothetical protein